MGTFCLLCNRALKDTLGVSRTKCPCNIVCEDRSFTCKVITDMLQLKSDILFFHFLFVLVFFLFVFLFFCLLLPFFLWVSWTFFHFDLSTVFLNIPLYVAFLVVALDITLYIHNLPQSPFVINLLFRINWRHFISLYVLLVSHTDNIIVLNIPSKCILNNVR